MRFRQRHVHATIYRTIKTQLAELGWEGSLFPSTPPNFGASPVIVLDYEPQQAGETPAPNTVAVSIDNQGSDDPWELGGIEICEYTLFVDVYGENEPIAISIADDIKAVLATTQMPVLDFTHSSDGEPTDAWIEFEDIVVDNITSTQLDKRSWRAVKATACCYF